MSGLRIAVLLLLLSPAVAQEQPAQAPARTLGTPAFRLPRDRALAVRWSPDGKLIAAGEHSLSVLSAATGEVLRTTRIGDRIRGIAWSPGGDLVVAARRKGALVVDPATGKVRLRLGGGGRLVAAVAWSPDGTRFAVGDSLGTVRLYDTAGKEVLRFDGGEKPVNALAFSPDGNRLASGGEDGKVRVRDLKDQAEARVLEGHEHPVTCVAWSRDESRIASGDRESGIVLWSGIALTEVRRMRRTEPWSTAKGMTGVAFSPDGRSLASAARHGWLSVWDCETGEVRWEARRHGLVGYVGGVDWSPDGARIVAGWGAVVHVRSAADGALPGKLVGHAAEVNALVFSPDGERLASGDDDGTIRLWQPGDGSAGKSWRAHDGPVYGLDWSSGGDLLASRSTDRKKGVRTWDPSTGEPVAGWTHSNPNIRVPLAFSPDGSLLACGRRMMEVRDPRTGERKTHLLGGRWDFMSVAWSPDGKRLLCTDAGERAEGRVFEVPSGKQLFSVPAVRNREVWIRFSPDGARLAGFASGLRMEWSGEDGTELSRRELTYRQDGYPPALSPDGRRVLLHTLEIVDLESDRIAVRLDRAGLGKAGSLAWSRDGTRVAAGFRDGRILTFDLPR